MHNNTQNEPQQSNESCRKAFIFSDNLALHSNWLIFWWPHLNKWFFQCVHNASICSINPLTKASICTISMYMQCPQETMADYHSLYHYIRIDFSQWKPMNSYVAQYLVGEHYHKYIKCLFVFKEKMQPTFWPVCASNFINVLKLCNISYWITHKNFTRGWVC